MLTTLTIRDVVLIDQLQLEGEGGLCALTGETGAGKSILLDALGLALGARAEAGLVRKGAEQASVTAAFDLPSTHPLIAALAEKGIEAAEGVILRRTLGRDGRSKAFINDTAVSVQLLKETGESLVEIHGQFETQGLLDPATHRAALDSYAGIEDDVKAATVAWAAWRAALDALDRAKTEAESMRLQEEYLKHAVAELERLNPREGEEDLLAQRRARLMNAGKLRQSVEQAAQILDSEGGVLGLLGRLQALLEKTAPAPVLESLARAKAEAEEVSYQLGKLDGADEENLEEIEERYFALKACAKKHRTTVDGLAAVQADLSQKLRLATDQDGALLDLEKAAAEARKGYAARAEKISAARGKAAGKLSKAVEAELPDLKLDKAKFVVACARLEENGWGPHGLDRVQFMISTNPGAAPGPLHKVASGGELARFMLALKAVLARDGGAKTLIFDEVDSGIGGAVAAAVGNRLARLAKTHQVLVVTHSPQVAARAAHHWHVAKTEQKGTVITKITPLTSIKDRQEEIARMLSGATVTKEARAQAARLLEADHAA